MLCKCEAGTYISLYYLLCELSKEIYCSQEAYVKALGKGFSGAPFKTFTIRLGNAIGEHFHLFQNSSAEVYAITVTFY